MMEQMTEKDADSVVDEVPPAVTYGLPQEFDNAQFFSQDDGERLYPNTVVSDNHENSALQNKEYEEGKNEEGAEREEDIYKTDEFFTWDKEPGEREYEEERYEERSLEDEEAEEERDAPSDDIATISEAEKLEEEVQQDVVGPDHVLAEIPVEVRINLSFCIILPVELLCLTTFVIF